MKYKFSGLKILKNDSHGKTTFKLGPDRPSQITSVLKGGGGVLRSVVGGDQGSPCLLSVDERSTRIYTNESTEIILALENSLVS